MQVEIYIDEQRVDTDIDTKIAETRQVNDFIEIKDRQTSFTNSFKLPKTERNKLLFGGMGISGNTSITPYRLHNVSIYRDGVQTIANGIGYFKSTNDNYNMYVYHENINLFDRMANKSIGDLNLFSLNHDLNIENWLASFDRNDYTYPIADYGIIDNTVIEINFQVPAVYIAYLWNKIFVENGFKWKYAGRGNQDDYNPFLSREWKELAISIDEGLPTNTDDVDPIKKLELTKNKISQFNAETITIFGNTIVVNALPEQITEYIRFATVFDPDGLHLFSTSIQDNRSRVRIKESGFYKMNVTGVFFNNNTDFASLFAEKDGVNVFSINEDFPKGQSDVSFTSKIYLKQGDEFLFKVITRPAELEDFYSYDLKVELIIDNSITAVNFSSYLGKLKQKTFFKDVINYLGLVYRRIGDTYEFISLEELLDPVAQYSNYNAEQNDAVYDDWSDKFNRVLNDDSKVGRYSRRNLFTYKYDNSEDTFGDGFIQIDDETLNAETTLIQRPYKAPNSSSTIIDFETLRSCHFYEKEFNEDGTLKDIKPVKGLPYFFRIKKVQSTIDYKLKGFDGNISFTGQIPFMSFDDLNFNNVLANRYAAFSNMLNYGQKITVELFLSVLDIHQLDFFRLKYIKQLGQLYYLNKIIAFTGSGLVKVELVKVRSIEKTGQFSDEFSDDFNT